MGCYSYSGKKSVKKKKRTFLIQLSISSYLFNLFKITRTIIQTQTSPPMPCLRIIMCDKSIFESSNVRVRETVLGNGFFLFVLILERFEETGCLHKYHSSLKNLYIFLY